MRGPRYRYRNASEWDADSCTQSPGSQGYTPATISKLAFDRDNRTGALPVLFFSRRGQAPAESAVLRQRLPTTSETEGPLPFLTHLDVLSSTI